jgi:hypothetical protein
MYGMHVANSKVENSAQIYNEVLQNVTKYHAVIFHFIFKLKIKGFHNWIHPTKEQ